MDLIVILALDSTASFSRYKREAYRHSVHAAKILSDAGIPVAMKVRGVFSFQTLSASRF